MCSALDGSTISSSMGESTGGRWEGGTTAAMEGRSQGGDEGGGPREGSSVANLPSADLETKVVKVVSMEEVLSDIKGRLQVGGSGRNEWVGRV